MSINKKKKLTAALTCLMLLSQPVMEVFAGFGNVDDNHIGVWAGVRGGGVTYATVGATIHKIDIDPVTGVGSDEPEDKKSQEVLPDTPYTGNPYVGYHNDYLVGNIPGATREQSIAWYNIYTSTGRQPAETHRDIGDFIYASWNWGGSTGVASIDFAQINWTPEAEHAVYGDDSHMWDNANNYSGSEDDYPFAYEINGVLVQDDKSGVGLIGGYENDKYNPATLDWLLGTGHDDPDLDSLPAWGWGAVYTLKPGYLQGIKHNESNSIDDNVGAILYNYEPSKNPNADNGRGGSGLDSQDPEYLINYYTSEGTKQEIRSRYGNLYLHAPGVVPENIVEDKIRSNDRYWEIGKSSPEGYTWNIGSSLKGSTPEFDIGVGIPATEDIKNGFVANAWYGKVKGFERETQKKDYTVLYKCHGEREVRRGSRGNRYWVDVPYTVNCHVGTYRKASYQAIYNADLRELNKVTVKNGAYGHNGPITYGPSDVNYNTINVELLINGKKLETPSVYKDNYPVKDEDHIEWPDDPPVQHKYIGHTGRRKWTVQECMENENLQEDADTLEALTVTTYSDKVEVNGITYLAGGSSSTHNAYVTAEGPKEVAIQNAAVTSNTSSGGHYLQRNNNTVVTIPSDVKNGEYATTLTLSYMRMVPRDGNAKDTIANGQAAILNESMYGQHFKSNEPIIVDTPVISPVIITDPEHATQLVKAPNASAYKLLLDGTYTLEFQPEVWESMDRSSDSGDSTLDGYENEEDTADRYDKYVAHKRVRFPFPVEALDLNDGDTQKYWPLTDTGFTEWIEIPKYSNVLKFYVPTWVTETNTMDRTNQKVYTAEFRVESISSDGLDDETEEEDINTDIENHVSTYTIDMIVAGSIYDFKIVGTSDKDMFSGYSEDVNEDTNIAFVPNYEEKRVGNKNRLGKDYIRYAYDGNVTTNWSSTNTLPLRNGTSNKYKDMGALWKGTTFSFSFKTIANLSEDNDSIIIKPNFKYVVMTNDADGNKINETYTNDQLVMFYSDEKGNYIKVGSAEDKTGHLRYVQLKNPQFRGSWYMGGTLEAWFTQIERDIISNRYGSGYLGMIPDDISYTTNKLGKTNIEFQNAKNYSYCMSEIKLDKNLRMLTGDREQLARNQSAMRHETNFDNITNLVNGGGNTVPENTFRNSMQTWYGQYTIPQKFYITTVDKLNAVGGLENYARNGKLSEDADLWLKDGYLIIGFDITTLNGGNEHLAYKAPNGVDMWDSTHENQVEKIKLPPQTKPMKDGSTPDTTEREVPIEHGDIVVVDLRYKQSDKLSARTFMIN